MYCFEENTFNIESKKLWDKFKRKKHGIRLTYIYLIVLQNEKTDRGFSKEFKSSAREISFRSGLCISQVKDHLNSLVLIKLVERKTTRKKKEDDNSYESESSYMVKPLNKENLDIATDSFVNIDIAKHVKQLDKKERSKL